MNSKRVRRLMREHGLSPKQRRRYVATTDSDHDEPIFPILAADMAPDGPNQLWVADIIGPSGERSNAGRPRYRSAS